ncbi:MAG: hypothetical protein KDC88_14470 [Ignavibacteriae bacterium]|nr:hypothetical protein [Ignavibacteriota bacterium]
MISNINKYSSIIILMIVQFISACSATSRYQILSTFFDGVPNPNEKQIQLQDTIKTDTLVSKTNLKIEDKNTPEFNYHPPYRNRMCSGCHNVLKGNALTKPIPQLCYNCHENITKKNPALHGPVAMGDCQVCHSPHLANNKFLLKRIGRELCLYCHEESDILENKNHFAAEEHGCLDCHDPHSGKDRFLLNE